MRRLAALAVALPLLAAACGGGANPPAAPREGDDAAARAYRIEGWNTDFAKRDVPLSEFRSGGPPKDGIPSIDEPTFSPAGKVDFVKEKEPVIELTVDGQVRGYPIQILIWHEIVNDRVAGIPVAVTFCPLCNTAIAFDRRFDGRVLEFGTTGKLRHSDLVMYDRQTETWWQQFGGRALVGELAGGRLTQLPARIVSWSEFRRDHPEAPVLDRPEDDFRPYGANPYEGYDDVDKPPFFQAANADDDRLPPKERVVFIERNGETAAIAFSALEERKTLTVEVGGDELEVRFRKGIASALDDSTVAGGRDVGAAEVLLDGEPVPFSEPFWFAVAAFAPETVVS